MRILRVQGCAPLTVKGATLGETKLEILLLPAKAEKVPVPARVKKAAPPAGAEQPAKPPKKG